jgi:hypothetical protein
MFSKMRFLPLVKAQMASLLGTGIDFLVTIICVEVQHN